MGANEKRNTNNFMNVAIIGLGNIGFNYYKNKKKKFLSLSKSFYKSDFFKLKIGIDKKKNKREF